MFAAAQLARRRAFSTLPPHPPPPPPKRESDFMRVWVKQSVAAWPIIGICGVLLVFCGSFLVHSFRNPENHFNKDERKTIDFIENKRDYSNESWKNSTFHKGPAFAHPEKRPFDHEK